MTDLENEAKQQLTESQQLEECPPDMAEGPMPAPTNPGNPVTMSVNLNASGAEHVQDLINMMKNAGLGDAKPADDSMMPVRQDMERLRAMVDEPEMEADEAYADSVEEGAMSDLHAEISSADDPAEMVMDIIKQGGPKGDYLSDELEKAAEALGLTLTNGDDVAQAVDALLQDMGIEEGYDNEPDPEYHDHELMTKDLSGGLNREKKAYAAAQRGDNAMAVEEIKAKLMAALGEKMDPVGQEDDDINNDGKKDKTDDYLKARREKISKAVADKKKKGPVEEVYNKTHVGNINDPETQKKMKSDWDKGVKAGQELKKMSQAKKKKDQK